MLMDNPFIFGLLFILLLLFLILKSAFNSLNEIQLELDKKRAIYHSRILTFIGNKTDEFLILVNICYFFVLTLLVYILNINLFALLPHIDHLLYYTLFVFFVSLIILPAFTIIPRAISEYLPNKIINVFAVFLVVFYILFFPITKVILLILNTPFKIIYKCDTLTNHKTNFNKEDLNKFVLENQKHIPKNNDINVEIKLFKNALEFADIKLRECMVPRTEIIAIDIEVLNDELKEKSISSGYSKIIVFKDSIENIIGYIKSKSLIYEKIDLKNEIKNIKFYPESMPANKLLRYFINSGQNIAVVVDEFGGVSGIVTIEDILEEIFGEINDEYDSEDLIEKKLSEQDYIFSGRLEIDYINDKYNINIPVDDIYETIAGFILYNKENLPLVNEQIIIENFKFTILKVSETRVHLVKLEISTDQE